VHWIYSIGKRNAIGVIWMLFRGHSVLLGLILGALVIAMPRIAISQDMGSCRGIDDARGEKVVLSKFTYSGDRAGEWSPKKLSELFYFEIESRLKAVLIGPKKGERQLRLPTIVLCINRQPSLDGTDFTPRVVDELNTRDVLLEVWGSISSRGTAKVDAWLAYALIPVCHYGGMHQFPGVHRVRYELQAEKPVEAIRAKIKSSAELAVYTALTYGIKALKKLDYDVAYSAMLIAQDSLESAIKNKMLSETNPDVVALRDYIGMMLKEIVSNARQDRNYRGALKKIEGVLKK